MISLLVYVVILVIVAIFLYWLLTQVAVPEPLRKILMIVVVAIGVIVLIGILLQFTHGGGIPQIKFGSLIPSYITNLI